MIDKNKIHLADCMDIMADMPDKCIDLIIADPPYFEVKGEFDFIWESFDDYLNDVDMWAQGFKRVLKDNGSLFVYGHAKKIAYKQVIFDRYFNLENNLVWFKMDCLPATKTNWKQSRAFAPVTERILFYSNEVEETGLQIINNDQELYKPIREYFQEERKKTTLTLKEINRDILKTTFSGGGMASNILVPYKKGWSFPTKEQYEKLQSIGICQKPYEELRREYEELRRPFDNYLKLYDVMKFSQEGHKTGKIDHGTVKPEALTRAIINTCSRHGDMVFIPFSGSGTECCMAHIEGREYIGCEKDEDYHRDSVKRLEEIQAQGRLFV